MEELRIKKEPDCRTANPQPLRVIKEAKRQNLLRGSVAQRRGSVFYSALSRRLGRIWRSERWATQRPFQETKGAPLGSPHPARAAGAAYEHPRISAEAGRRATSDAWSVGVACVTGECPWNPRPAQPPGPREQAAHTRAGGAGHERRPLTGSWWRKPLAGLWRSPSFQGKQRLAQSPEDGRQSVPRP